MIGSADRAIPVEGSFNVRDLGGLTTADGRSVRRGQLFRSDYPGFADVDEGAVVRRLGLAQVVDLRRRNEAELECVDWAAQDVAYVRCPISAGDTDSWHARYQAYLTQRPETVVAAVRALMTTRPALFHCAAGKDRTGTIAALLLGVLGVPDEQVVADYVLTQDALPSIWARLQSVPLYARMLADSSEEDQSPRAEHMAGFLTWLGEQGGAEAWLVAHGITAEECEEFRSALLIA